MERTLVLTLLAASAQAVAISTGAAVDAAVDVVAQVNGSHDTRIKEHTFAEHETISFGNCELSHAFLPGTLSNEPQLAVFEASKQCTHGARVGARLSRATASRLGLYNLQKSELECKRSPVPGLDDCSFTLQAGERAGWATDALKSQAFGAQTPILEVLEPEKIAGEVISNWVGFRDEKYGSETHYRTASGGDKWYDYDKKCKYWVGMIDKPEGTYLTAESLSECTCSEDIITTFVPFTDDNCMNDVTPDGMMIGIEFKDHFPDDYATPFYLNEPVKVHEYAWGSTKYLSINTKIHGVKEFSGFLIQFFSPPPSKSYYETWFEN